MATIVTLLLHFTYGQFCETNENVAMNMMVNNTLCMLLYVCVHTGMCALKRVYVCMHVGKHICMYYMHAGKHICTYYMHPCENIMGNLPCRF